MLFNILAHSSLTWNWSEFNSSRSTSLANFSIQETDNLHEFVHRRTVTRTVADSKSKFNICNHRHFHSFSICELEFTRMSNSRWIKSQSFANDHLRHCSSLEQSKKIIQRSRTRSNRSHQLTPINDQSLVIISACFSYFPRLAAPSPILTRWCHRCQVFAAGS